MDINNTHRYVLAHRKQNIKLIPKLALSTDLISQIPELNSPVLFVNQSESNALSLLNYENNIEILINGREIII